MSNIENTSAYRGAYLGAVLAARYPDCSPHRVALAVVAMQRAARRAVAWQKLSLMLSWRKPRDRK